MPPSSRSRDHHWSSSTRAERDPLLSRHHGSDETETQRRLREKLHTFQMGRALSQGFMPSTSQVISGCKKLLASDVLRLQGNNHDMSPSGRTLVRLVRTFLEQTIVLVRNKNGEDQLQYFLWFVSQLNLPGKGDRGGSRIRKELQAKSTAACQSLQTIGSLLLVNKDFRMLLSDLTSIGREVFQDTALALSSASHEAAERVGSPSNSEESGSGSQENTAVSTAVADGASHVAVQAKESISNKGARDVLFSRLQDVVRQLRQRPDYEESVSTLSTLLQRYADMYVGTIRDKIEEVVGVAEEAGENIAAGRANGNIHRSDQGPENMDEAFQGLGSFIASFGNVEAWQELDARFKHLLDRSRDDHKKLDAFFRLMGNALQDMLTNPGFFDHADERMEKLREDVRALDGSSESSSTLLQDGNALLEQLQTTLQAVLDDEDVFGLAETADSIADLLWPSGQAYANPELLGDALNVFLPLCLEAIHYIPVPRVELATPPVDVLLENLVLEPGRTAKQSSFLPSRLHVQLRHDVEIRQARFGTASSVATTASIQLDGLSVAAEDVGYVLRLHPTSKLLPTMRDRGLASLWLDGRGIDIQADVRVVRDQAETMLALQSVSVHIHKLNYSLRSGRRCSPASCLSRLAKPVVRPLARRLLERQLARAVGQALQDVNRELVFARERLRAARIASGGGGDLFMFLRAVLARYSSSSDLDSDPDRSLRVGIRPSRQGVFAGVYAPGSLAEVWKEEALQVDMRVEEYRKDGWRNGIFEV